MPWPPPKGWRKALLRGETPEYRRPREERLSFAIMEAQQAITDFYTPETKEAKSDAERWLLVAYEANRGTR